MSTTLTLEIAEATINPDNVPANMFKSEWSPNIGQTGLVFTGISQILGSINPTANTHLNSSFMKEIRLSEESIIPRENIEEGYYVHFYGGVTRLSTTSTRNKIYMHVPDSPEEDWLTPKLPNWVEVSTIESLGGGQYMINLPNLTESDKTGLRLLLLVLANDTPTSNILTYGVVSFDNQIKTVQYPMNAIPSVDDILEALEVPPIELNLTFDMSTNAVSTEYMMYTNSTINDSVVSSLESDIAYSLISQTSGGLPVGTPTLANYAGAQFRTASDYVNYNYIVNRDVMSPDGQVTINRSSSSEISYKFGNLPINISIQPPFENTVEFLDDYETNGMLSKLNVANSSHSGFIQQKLVDGVYKQCYLLKEANSTSTLRVIIPATPWTIARLLSDNGLMYTHDKAISGHIPNVTSYSFPKEAFMYSDGIYRASETNKYFLAEEGINFIKANISTLTADGLYPAPIKLKLWLNKNVNPTSGVINDSERELELSFLALSRTRTVLENHTFNGVTSNFVAVPITLKVGTIPESFILHGTSNYVNDNASNTEANYWTSRGKSVNSLFRYVLDIDNNRYLVDLNTIVGD